MTNSADVRSHDYTINVVMTRRQELRVDLTPSVPRLKDENGNTTANIDPDQIDKAVDDFWTSTSGITYGYSTEQYIDGKPISYNQHEDTLTRVSLTGDTQKSGVLVKSGVENLQWINFNLPPEDKIVYNGRTYNGNDRIYLSVADLAMANMTFYYYDSEYLSSTSIMTATISGIELFLDGDANGKIDGYYNAETGYFILDKDSDDQSLGFLDPDTDYNEYLFTPVPVTMEDGTVKYGQYFMKVRYTMNPRALIPADGVDTASARAQVLPAFVSTVTDPDSYEALTAEQQAYRYIISGLTKLSADGDEVRSSDGHPMYGAEATQPSIVDVPLGGDTNPAQLTEDGSAYTWDPDYQGNLLARFVDPEPIFIDESVAGPNIPIAEVTGYDKTTGVKLEEGGADKLNGYLGSLTANNTVALCVQEQTATTDEIAEVNGVTIGGGDVALQSEGAGEEVPGINPESVTPSDTKTTPDARYLQETGAAAEPDGQIDMSGSENEYSEFNQDFNVQLPSTDSPSSLLLPAPSGG